MRGEAKGFLAVWADVEAAHRQELQKWHNCQHLTERVTIPGFHVGRRYFGLQGAHDFLMYYETDDAAIMQSEAYLRALNNPTPWSRQIIGLMRHTKRGIYTLLAATGRKARTEAPYLFLLQFNIQSGLEAEVIQGFEKGVLPKIARIPGVDRARLYGMDAEVSNLMTGERKIHGGGPGEQQYLAYIEMESTDLPDGEEWKEGLALEGSPNRIKDAVAALYWLDFVLYAPGASRLD